MLQIISLLLNAMLTSGLLVTLATLRASRKKASAEATSAEIDEERAAWRETDYNIQTTRIDTIYQTTNSTTQQSAKTQTKIRVPDSTIGWIMATAITLTVVLIITIAAAIAIKSLRI